MAVALVYDLIKTITRLICTLRIDLKGTLKNLPCKLYPEFFQVGTLKKVGCHTYKSGEHPEKIWVDFTG